MKIAIFNKSRRAHLRRTMRAYRRMRAAESLGRIDDVCAKLAATPAISSPRSFSNLFFGAATPHAGLAVQQYAYRRQVLYRLPQALLGNIGALIHPLPRTWQTAIAGSGIPVNRPVSSLLWLFWLVLYWGHGTVQVAKLLAVTAKAALSGQRQNTEDFSHFEYITQAQTIRPASDGRSFDVMSWYLQWSGRPASIAKLTYRGDRYGEATPFKPALGLAGWLSFAVWSIAATAVSFFDIFTGRWWHPLLLGEAALAKLARTVPEQSLAKDYLFNNSAWLYRPLWTYEAEQRGSRILFYHYSTNSAAFKRHDGYPPEHYTWPLSNWPLHLVWDHGQADFVQRAVSSVETDIVGPIWFASSPEDMPELPPSTIAVFDVQPFRPSRAPALAVDFNYYEADTCTAFIDDVASACASLHYQMAWKRKRNIGKMAHPRYRQIAQRLDSQPHVHIVPADHSAIRVIEQSNAVVSLPFTSTALLAAQLGKPSCYYDPAGLIHKDDRAAHDIPVITGYEELLAWIRSIPGSASASESHASIS